MVQKLNYDLSLIDSKKTNHLKIKELSFQQMHKKNSVSTI